MQELLTLAPGDKKRRFKADIVAGECIRIETGRKHNGASISWQEYKRMVAFFRPKGFFPLGSRIDSLKEGGMGEYFQDVLKKSPRYASHYAAVMVYLKDAKVVHDRPLTLRII
ncbi:MAG: hypothetical protein WAX07_06430 [Candidatus Altiarchaeia archaeon]